MYHTCTYYTILCVCVCMICAGNNVIIVGIYLYYIQKTKYTQTSIIGTEYSYDYIDYRHTCMCVHCVHCAMYELCTDYMYICDYSGTLY